MTRFDTDRRSTTNSPEHQRERDRRQQLPYLIERLGELAPDVPDPALREEIHRWRILATRLPTDGRQYVENQLEKLNDDYEMYRARGMDNDECFPQKCLDNCEHAQRQACAMLYDRDVKRQRRRITDSDPTPDEYRDEMKALAADVDCHVVSKALRVVEELHNPIIRYGQLLLSQAEEDVVHGTQSDALAAELAAMDLEELADDADIDLPSADEVDETVGDTAPATGPDGADDAVGDASGDDDGAEGHGVRSA